jgi:hypothetical protein
LSLVALSWVPVPEACVLLSSCVAFAESCADEDADPVEESVADEPLVDGAVVVDGEDDGDVDDDADGALGDDAGGDVGAEADGDGEPGLEPTVSVPDSVHAAATNTMRASAPSPEGSFFIARLLLLAEHATDLRGDVARRRPGRASATAHEGVDLARQARRCPLLDEANDGVHRRPRLVLGNAGALHDLADQLVHDCLLAPFDWNAG